MCMGIYAADVQAPYNDPVAGQATYKSHFYDPDSGENWMHETDPTALTRGRMYFSLARDAYFDGDMGHAGYLFGLSLHYLTDLSQPMHAGNFTYISSWLWG